jgi:hypothetical protein
MGFAGAQPILREYRMIAALAVPGTPAMDGALVA